MIDPDYLDGCTLFPDRFGPVSHRHVCDAHDRRYWLWRDPWRKVWADCLWSAGIVRAHLTNTPWQPVALIAALIGWAGLMTAGWWFWKRRHRFGPR